MKHPRIADSLHVLLFLLLRIEVAFPSSDLEEPVRVNKCCEKFEIFYRSSCGQVNSGNSSWQDWKPIFYNYEGHVANVNYKFLIGVPACGTKQSWPIYGLFEGPDQLRLLEDGKLRHYTRNMNEENEDDNMEIGSTEPLYYDYSNGEYCLDKAVTGNNTHELFAMVCLPEKNVSWTDTDFLMRKIINPIFHVIGIMILLTVSIIYFILPTLRDLMGNIITTISVCLVISQCANLVRIFTEFSNHVSFLVADSILYVSLLGAFFWLSTLGYYIWKTFRSRNVFLRVTDGRKYCWYSGFVWGSTGIMTALAIFSHYFLDSPLIRKQYFVDTQESIGWLGIAVFFSPIGISLLVDLFFCITTLQLLKRRNVYGRIQHKLKSNFVLYYLLCLILGINWIILILSWSDHEGLIYTYIISNAIQAPLILYVCVFKQKHVLFLLKKSCCYNGNPSLDWGDEMNYINGNEY